MTIPSPNPAPIHGANGEIALLPTVEATIERIVPGGAGLAHAAGRTLFVELAAPGDRVRVTINQVRGKVAFGTIAEVLEPGPERVTPPCPYVGSCGGCDFQHLSYPAQLAAKRAILHDSLRRIGGIDLSEEIPIVPAPDPWAYRARAEWRHDPASGAFGYLHRHSHDVEDVDICIVLTPPLQATLTELRERRAAAHLPATLREVRAVAGDDNTVGLAPPLAPGGFRPLQVTVAGETFHFDATCFFQINLDLLGGLVEEALRFVPLPAPGTLTARGIGLDLYCGVGLFTLPLARRLRRVIGVEAYPPAAAFAMRNMAQAGLTNVQIKITRVGGWLAQRAAQPSPIAFALVDPPRAGLERDALGALTALAPTRIAYVSCDPATLARDLRHLIAHGYTLDGLTAFDLFPQTHHIEAVAHLVHQAVPQTTP
jgi:23S rRNA (uracil1939-C5)-methyltransferase